MRAADAAREPAFDPARDHGLDRRGALRVDDRRPTCWPGAPMRPTCLSVGEPRVDFERPQLREAARARRGDQPLRRGDEIAADATKARAFPIRCSTRCSRRRRKGALDRGHRPLVRRRATASPRARTASSASSTSGTTQEERLTYLSRFDGLTGEMNRFHLTEVLDNDARRRRWRSAASCGFMLVAVDNLARINESYGFDVADEAIGAVAKRLRTKMRGGDQLGRFSGNKFGIILNNCTPDDMEKAAERLIAGVRDDVVPHRRGSGRRHRHHRRRHRAAPCRDRAGNPRPRAGDARPRQGQAARLVPDLSAERRARGAAPRERARRRRDRHRAQRAAHPAGVRAGGRDRTRGRPPSTNA